MTASMKLFPDEVSLAPLALASLVGVAKDGNHVIARYRLEADDPLVFRARMGAHPDISGQRYEPIPGVWSQVQLSEEGCHVDIGVRETYGRAWINAIRQHNRNCDHMIPSYQIKAQILGFLADNGV